MPRLTIVLTLKDRPEFTRRWMRFMNDQRCPYKILIADGGADKVIEAQLRDSTHYPNLDYEYIRYPYDNEFKDYYAKKQDVCEKVETEYLLLADNDDFYLLDKIPLLIDFLDCNPDYSGCRGATAQFSLLSKSGEVINAPVGESYMATQYESRSIENETFIERAKCFFNEVNKYYWLNWYCIFRSEKVVSGMKNIYKYRYSDVVLNEMLFSLWLLREGKIKVIDLLFYARQDGSSQSSVSLNVENNLLELFLINDVFHHFNDFIMLEGFVLEESDRIRILKSFANFVGTWCNSYSDQYRKESLMQACMRSFISLLKRNKRLFHLIHWYFIRFSHVLRGTQKRHAIRIPVIENYVLSSKTETDRLCFIKQKITE